MFKALLNNILGDKFKGRKIHDEIFSIFDTETTGLDTDKDKICSFAGVKATSNKVLKDTLVNQYINPKIPIPLRSSRIHGIYDFHVTYEPVIENFEDTIVSFLQGSVICGHNINFDFLFFKREFKKKIIHQILKDQPIIDTLYLSAALFPELQSYGLNYLCEKFNIKLEKRHTALGDTLMTADLLLYLLQEAMSRNITTISEIIKLTKSTKKLNYAQLQVLN